MNTKHFLVVLGLILFTFSSQAQSLQKGYDAFIQNKIEDAVTYFEDAKSNPAEKSEALLMLALLYEYQYKNAESYAAMTEFVKTSENPEPYMDVLWTGILFGGYDKLSSAQITLLNSIIKDAKYSGYLKARANYSLGSHFSDLGDFKKSKSYHDKIGSVVDFAIVGSFENISASGFNKEFEPIKKPNADAVFKNKNHADVNWFSVNYNVGTWIDFGKHFGVDNSIYFAQTFCNSTSDQEVILNIGTSGSIKIWINDKLIYSEEEERNNDMDTYKIPAKLYAGSNRILLQIGASDVARANFMLRFTDEKGNVIPGLTYERYKNDYNKKYDYKGELIPSKTEAELRKKIKENPKSLVYHILLSKKLLANDYSKEAREVIDDAIKIGPDCSYLLFQKMLVYIKDQNRTALSEALESMRKIDPTNVLSLNMDYDEAKNAENFTKCNEIISKLENKIGMTEDVYEKKISMAATEKRIDDLLELNKAALKAFPDNYNFVELQFRLEKEYHKNPSGAIKVLQTFIKKNYHVTAMENLAQCYFESGSSGFSKGMDILIKLATDQPNRAPSYNTLAGVYFAIKDFDNAEKYYQKCLEIAPFISSYTADLGLCYEQMSGRTDDAKKYYRMTIMFNPNDYETRANLRKLDGEKDVWEIFETPETYTLFEKEYKKSDYPEDNSVLILDETQRVIYKGGGSETKYYLAVKTLNVDGVDTWKEYYIPSGGSQSLNVEKAEIIKKNGNRIKAEVNYNAVVFTGLEPGDGILLIYKVQNYYSGKLSEHFWDKQYLNSFYPIEKSTYKLMVPEGTKFESKVINSDIQPVQTRSDGFDQYVWESTKQPSIKSENYMPRLVDVGKVLHISSFPNWDFISEWYTDLAITKSKSSPEVKETLAKILTGNENASELEKARLIYNYIVKEIRYSSVSFRQSGLIPQKASDVITTKIGDCKDVSTLFVALCKEAGLNAQLVLVNTRDNGLQDLALPSIEFNHCIAKLNVGADEYYIELTSDNMPFSTINESLKNAFTLDVTGNTTLTVEPKYLNPKTSVKNMVWRTSDIKFDGMKMIVKKNSYKTGAFAASMRNSFRHKGEEEQFKEMTESISSDFQSMKMKELKFDANLDNSSDTVSYFYAYDVNNAMTSIGDLFILKIPFSDGLEPFEFLSNEKRVYDIEFWKILSSENTKEVMTFEIPKGKKLAELPKNISYKTNFAEYNLTFAKTATGITITREFKVLADMIGAAQFEEAKKFFENVVTADKQQIGFKNVAP